MYAPARRCARGGSLILVLMLPAAGLGAGPCPPPPARADHPDRRVGRRARHRRAHADRGRGEAAGRLRGPARPADPDARGRPARAPAPGRHRASCSTRARPPGARTSRRRRRPSQPDGGRYVDVPLHVTYDRAAARRPSPRCRPRGRTHAAQRAPAHHRAPDVPAPRAHGLVDRRAGAGRARSIRCSPTRTPPGSSALRARARAARVNANDLRHQHRVIVTVDRAHFKLRYFKNLKRRKSYGVAVGMPGHATPTRALLDRQQGREPGLDGARRSRGPAPIATRSSRAARPTTRSRRAGSGSSTASASTGPPRTSRSARARRTAASACGSPDVIDLYPRVPVGSTVLIR